MKIIIRLMQSIVIIVGGAALYLFVVGIIPGISAPAQPLKRTKTPEPGPDAVPGRSDVQFYVDGVVVNAWLYLPASRTGPVPCVVMAHGLGGTRDMGLDDYAQRFRTNGYAVLAFDYRYFGASGGEPRQLIWIPDQLEDWKAAIAFVRSRPEIDSSRIALWGTSLSGGHVIVTAAEDHDIACVVAQCPGVDGRESAEVAFFAAGVGNSLRLVMHAQRDLVRSWLGLSPHKVPIVGVPGSLALMASDEAYAVFSDLAPGIFVNEACARIAIRGDKYRPVTYASRVRCPVLLQICDQDALTPANAAADTVRRLGANATEMHYQIGHFDIYFGDNRERSLRDQLTFLQRHLA